MERERASDPDFWSGRGKGESTEVPRRPAPAYRRRRLGLRGLGARVWRRPKLQSPPRVQRAATLRARGRTSGSGGRARPVAAAVLLATLTLAWLGAGHRSRGASGAALTTNPSVPASRPTPTTDLAGAPCGEVSPDRPAVRCALDGVDVRIRLYSPGTAAAAYRRASGVDAAAHSGPPTCERGAPDERAWSDATAPDVVVGRYRCLIEDGHAAMWWTRGNRVAHAVAGGGDLRALFAWWRSHPSE